MLKIHEFSAPSGELQAIRLRVRDGALELVTGDGAWPLPEGALSAVLARFGAPYDDAAPIREVARLIVSHAEVLRHVRHLAGYDVIARDYLVYEAQGSEPLCALSATVSAALLHLARATRS
jgi:hypothetical protein